MKFSSEFRDKEAIKVLVNKIRERSHKNIKLMEVCGGHTMSIQRFGIPSLLPSNIELISGPGCPVCVTGRDFIDKSIFLSRLDDTIITTYGDLIRVPGTEKNLDRCKAEGADIRIVYSVTESLKIAKENPDKNVIFLGIGFETTAPATAVAIKNAVSMGLKNYYVLSAHKIMPPAMEALITEDVRIDGYLAPGHVSTITGSSIYEFIPEKHNIACVISGFEPADILQSIFMLANQIEKKDFQVEIQYSRAVSQNGNINAQDFLNDVFELGEDWWRGLGVIPKSGYKIKQDYSAFDAEKNFNIKIPEPKDDPRCICGEVLKGKKKPKQCKLFATECTPVNPVGACMVSSEGACAAYYKYNRK